MLSTTISVHAKLLQSCPPLCDPMHYSLCTRLLCPLVSLAKNTGVGCCDLLQGSSQPRDRTHVSYVSCIGRRVLYHESHLGSPLTSRSPLKCHLLKNYLANQSKVIFPPSIFSCILYFLSFIALTISYS